MLGRVNVVGPVVATPAGAACGGRVPVWPPHRRRGGEGAQARSGAGAAGASAGWGPWGRQAGRPAAAAAGGAPPKVWAVRSSSKLVT